MKTTYTVVFGEAFHQPYTKASHAAAAIHSLPWSPSDTPVVRITVPGVSAESVIKRGLTQRATAAACRAEAASLRATKQSLGHRGKPGRKTKPIPPDAIGLVRVLMSAPAVRLVDEYAAKHRIARETALEAAARELVGLGQPAPEVPVPNVPAIFSPEEQQELAAATHRLVNVIVEGNQPTQYDEPQEPQEPQEPYCERCARLRVTALGGYDASRRCEKHESLADLERRLNPDDDDEDQSPTPPAFPKWPT